MTSKALLAVLILAALLAVPAFAGERIALSGVLETASAVSVQAETATRDGSIRVESLAHKLVMVLGPGRRAVLGFVGSLAPDGGVLIQNRNGAEAVAYPGDTVSLLAVFACSQPGGDAPCGLFLVRVVEVAHVTE